MWRFARPRTNGPEPRRPVNGPRTGAGDIPAAGYGPPEDQPRLVFWRTRRPGACSEPVRHALRTFSVDFD
jgi:hypothetical protein